MTDPPEAVVARLLAELALPSQVDPSRALDTLRARVFRAVRRATCSSASVPVQPSTPALPDAAAPYAEQVRRLAELLGAPDLSAAREVVHGWSVRDTLAHLVAVDGQAAEALGLITLPETGATVGPSGDPAGSTSPEQVVLARTSAVQDLHAGRPLAELIPVWLAQAEALLRHAAALGTSGIARQVSYLGLPLTVADVLLDRAFETWIHAEDLRAAIGRPPAPPPPGHLYLMSDLGIRMIGPVMAGLLATGLPVPAGQVHVVLTGDGGGSWDVTAPSGPGSSDRVQAPAVTQSRATITLTAIDFCYLAGGRLGVHAVRHESDGDPDLARATLVATATLARP
jgi:uncharacterized protein (TIGR03083 family)